MQAPDPSRPHLTPETPVHIVGQGLSGSLVALLLHDAGIPFTVQDAALPGRATVVAPGIVNPLAGRSFRPPEHLDKLMESLRGVMAVVERHLGIIIWHSCPILRMFAEPTQADRMEKTLSRDEWESYVADRYPDNTFAHLNDVYGSFTTRGGGWANLPLLVEATRAWLRAHNRLIEEPWTPNQPATSNQSPTTILCEGWQAANNPHWKFIPHNPAKGEMLIVRFEEPLPRDRIYNQTCWVQPIEDDLWRVGATYSWKDFDSVPSVEGTLELQERLRLLTPIPFHVVDQVAGVRAITSDYHPVIGAHPDNPRWFILNALGSKGVLQAPAAAQALLELLRAGVPVPPEWAVERFCR